VYLCELCGSIAEHEEPETGEVESGVLADLATLPPEASDRTIAKMMIAMARRIDYGDVADRDVAPITKEIRQMYAQLKLDYPPEPEEDDTERTRRRREKMLMMDDYEH
jgi:SpoVK/Ycf46/Vps4 family AAA+-type ATPase